MHTNERVLSCIYLERDGVYNRVHSVDSAVSRRCPLISAVPAEMKHIRDVLHHIADVDEAR